MDFPPAFIADTLKGFCVCYFKNTDHDPESPPHYHITVPISDASYLLLCVITSQMENRIKYYQRTNKRAVPCLVKVDKNDLHFLNKESIIECNQPMLVRKKNFGRIVDSKQKCKVIMRDIPSYLKEKIVKAINDSPIVRPFFKKLLK